MKRTVGRPRLNPRKRGRPRVIRSATPTTLRHQSVPIDDDQDETQDVTVNDPEYLRILEQLVQTRNQKLEKIQHWRECELEVIQKWQDFQTKQAWDEFKYAIETSREARIRKVKEKINKLQQEFNELKETV